MNALPAVVAAEPGLVTALDLPLVTGRGLVTGSGHTGTTVSTGSTTGAAR